MKVILLKDVGGVGKRETAVDVSDGYALNFLIPRGLAVHASPEKLAQLKDKKEVQAMSAAATDAANAAHAKKLSGMQFHVSARANEQRHLYQHLSADMIASAIKRESGIAVPVAAIRIPQPIKTLGDWDLQIAFGAHIAHCTLAVAAA